MSYKSQHRQTGTESQADRHIQTAADRSKTIWKTRQTDRYRQKDTDRQA